MERTTEQNHCYSRLVALFCGAQFCLLLVFYQGGSRKGIYLIKNKSSCVFFFNYSHSQYQKLKIWLSPFHCFQILFSVSQLQRQQILQEKWDRRGIKLLQTGKNQKEEKCSCTWGEGKLRWKELVTWSFISFHLSFHKIFSQC